MWDTSNNDTCSLQTTNTGQLSCHSPVGGPPADHQADHKVEPVRACDQCPQHVGYVKIRAPYSQPTIASANQANSAFTLPWVVSPADQQAVDELEQIPACDQHVGYVEQRHQSCSPSHPTD